MKVSGNEGNTHLGHPIRRRRPTARACSVGPDARVLVRVAGDVGDELLRGEREEAFSGGLLVEGCLKGGSCAARSGSRHVAIARSSSSASQWREAAQARYNSAERLERVAKQP